MRLAASLVRNIHSQAHAASRRRAIDAASIAAASRRVIGRERATAAHRAYTTHSQLPSEHRMVYEMCRKFADEELSPNAGKWDKEHSFPTEAVDKLVSFVVSYKIYLDGDDGWGWRDEEGKGGRGRDKFSLRRVLGALHCRVLGGWTMWFRFREEKTLVCITEMISRRVSFARPRTVDCCTLAKRTKFPFYLSNRI